MTTVTVQPKRKSTATFILRHEIEAIQRAIEHMVYLAEIACQQASQVTGPFSETLRAEIADYEESIDRLRRALACLLDTDDKELER